MRQYWAPGGQLLVCLDKGLVKGPGRSSGSGSRTFSKAGSGWVWLSSITLYSGTQKLESRKYSSHFLSHSFEQIKNILSS